MQHVPPVFAAQSPNFVTGPRENLSEIDLDIPSNLSRDFENLSGKIMLTMARKQQCTGHGLNRNDH